MIINKLRLRRSSTKVVPTRSNSDDDASDNIPSSCDPPASSTCNEKKQVRFDLSSNVFYSSEFHNIDLWYSKEDLTSFRENTMRKAQRILVAKADQSSSAFNYVRKMEYLHEVCLSGTPAANFCTKFLPEVSLEDSLDLIGMEPWILPQFRYFRESRRREVLHLAVSISKSYGDQSVASSEKRSELICKECRRVTKPAKGFAAVVAKLHLRLDVWSS